MKRKTLFLDFDGVLHPLGSDKSDNFKCCSYLESSLADIPCEIVISSNWRIKNSVEYMISILPENIGKRVIGITQIIPPQKFKRYREISLFISANHLEKDNWIAVDDMFWEFPKSCTNLVICNPNQGLSLKEKNKITNWLKS